MSLVFRSGIPQALFPAVPPARAQRALALQYQLAHSERRPLSELRALQLAQLSPLAAHACAHLPWWRERFSRAGVDPTQPLTLDALRSLPLLTRHDLQDQGAALFSPQLPQGHGRVGKTQTSGSSGTPVVVQKSELTLLYWQAITLREHLWHQRDLQQTTAFIRYLPQDAEAATPEGRRVPSWGPPTDQVFATGPSLMMSVQNRSDVQAKWLLQHRPAYLLTYPSALRELLDHWEAWDERPEGLRQVRTISEGVPEGLRERCRAISGARLVDTYSTQEVGYIALQCPEHDHYHLQSESCLTEILRADGTPCEPGEIGRVVVTPLHHFAMPLFRYDIGDMAEVGEPCPCGRTLPVIRRVVGRVREMLRHPDGRTSWPVFGGQHFRSVAPVRQWRVVQRALDEVILQIHSERPLTPSEADALVALARDHSGWQHGLEVESHDEPLPRTSSGKYPDFVCQLPPDLDPLTPRR